MRSAAVTVHIQNVDALTGLQRGEERSSERHKMLPLSHSHFGYEMLDLISFDPVEINDRSDIAQDLRCRSRTGDYDVVDISQANARQRGDIKFLTELCRFRNGFGFEVLKSSVSGERDHKVLLRNLHRACRSRVLENVDRQRCPVWLDQLLD